MHKVRVRRHKAGCKVAIFYDAIYGVELHLLWPAPQKVLDRYLFGLGCGEVEAIPGSTARAIMLPDEPICLVAMDGWNGSAEAIAVLCHECNHIALWVMEYVGIPVEPDNCEAFTYYQAALVRTCIDALRQK